MIKFGTDGWRGLIARDFTFDNVRLVAMAAAKLIKKMSGGKDGSAVIGYDTRFLSGEFARETALVFASQGIKSYLTDKCSSTPQVSWHTKEKNVTLGIIITASHNPAVYNGFKLKGAYGGPATPEMIAELEAELKDVMNNPFELILDAYENYKNEGLIELFDAKAPFVSYIRSKIDLDKINAAGFKILYDPMHGAGIDTIRELIPNADEIHGEYNPSFGDLDHPEPIGEVLTTLSERVKEGGYDLGLATDGDADRLGAMDEEGNFVDSHRIFMILLKYLYEIKGERGIVVKTVSLTSMVNKYCEKMGIELHETPVGFKYTAKLMTEQKVIIGGEESGGLGTALHIPERDGLFNAMLLLEAMTSRKMSLKQMTDELDAEFGVHRYRRRDVVVTTAQKSAILSAAENAPKKLGRFDVISINKADGYKFMVENGWLLIRASGTEPLIRFYAEADSIEKVDELLDEGFALSGNGK